jgi:hypothetical protein
MLIIFASDGSFLRNFRHPPKIRNPLFFFEKRYLLIFGRVSNSQRSACKQAIVVILIPSQR